MQISNGVKEKVAVISILANILLAGGKIIIGTIANSVAVLAEGIHSFMDIFSSAISFFGIRISKKPGDEKHPYGHYKFEVLSGLLITLILLATAAGIIYEAYQKFLNPSLIKIPILAFGVMIFSTLINEIMARLKIHFGKKENSISLLSDGFHSRIDVYTSVTVLISLFLSKYWIRIDSLLAFFIGFYIIKKSFSLGKEAVDSLLDVSAGKEIEEKIKSIAKTQNIIISNLKTQKKGSVVTSNFEIELPNSLSVEKATETSNNLRERLMKEIENLVYVAIQIKSHEVSTGFYKPFLGRSFGWQRRGRFRGELNEAKGYGPGGSCFCPNCGYRVEHQRGVPCLTLQCPKCKINLERK